MFVAKSPYIGDRISGTHDCVSQGASRRSHTWKSNNDTDFKY